MSAKKSSDGTFFVERWYDFLGKKVGPPGGLICVQQKKCNSAYHLRQSQNFWAQKLADQAGLFSCPKKHTIAPPQIAPWREFLARIRSPTRRASAIV